MEKFPDIVIAAIVSAIVSSLVTLLVWNWQQTRLQQWSSRPVIEFLVTPEKVLTIRNLGSVDISDVTLSFTTYEVKAEIREGGHLYLGDGLEKFSKAGGQQVYPRLVAGDTITLPLKHPEVANPFLPFYPVADQSLEHFKQQYAIRILFRNAITKQKYVSYLVVAALDGVNLFNLDVRSAFTGSMQSAENIFKIRDAIRAHQAKVFDDRPDDFYQ